MTQLHVSLAPDASCSSIQEAYNTLVTMKTNGTLSLPATIYVHKGTYPITKRLLFQEELPVTIQAYKNEEVIIDGGTEITNWKQTTLNGKKVFRAELPDTLDPEDITQLYVNTSLRYPACFPKAPNSFCTAEEVLSEQDKFSSFLCHKEDFDPHWYDPQNIWVIMPHMWAEERARIRSFDPDKMMLHFQTSFCHIPRKTTSEYRFYNVREALTEPGEYYIDRLEKAVYYLPEKGETLKNLSVMIPANGLLAEINGAQWLTLEGLTFRYGGSYYPLCDMNFDLRNGKEILNGMFRGKTKASRKLLQGEQASLQVPGIIFFNNAKNCVVRKCTILNCGWYGIAVGCGCKNITLEENLLHHLGGGGIRISGGRWSEVVEANKPELATSHITVKNNHIFDCGQIFLSAVGIVLTDVRSCLVENNHIHDLYYSGISCGWNWGFHPNMTAENRIIGNHVHHLGKGVMSDMGGIYLLGIQPGTRVAENVVHDIQCRQYGGWGLYTDEGSSHIILEHNLVYNCSCQAYTQHYGRENIVRENVLAFGKDAVINVTNMRQQGYASPGQHYGKAISFYKNLVITDGVPFFRTFEPKIFSENRMDSEGNIFCNLADSQKVFAFCQGEKSFASMEEWQKQGFDLVGKYVEDSGFIDPAKGDFRLKKSSWLKNHPWFKWLKNIL